MSITAAEVNKLRKQTGAGMMDCKKALTEANGDFEAAIEILRKKAKRWLPSAATEAGEGAILSGVNGDGNVGVVISLNCETDFVAKNDDFVSVAKTLLDLALSEGVESKEDLLTKTYTGSSLTVADKITEEVGKIGERIEIGDLRVVRGEKVVAYIHPGNRLATAVAFEGEVSSEVGATWRCKLRRWRLWQSMNLPSLKISLPRSVKSGRIWPSKKESQQKWQRRLLRAA